MKYKIYKLIKPEQLQETEPDGYYIKSTERVVLEIPDNNSGLNETFSNIDVAKQAIVDNKNKNVCCEFCILPIINVNMDRTGDIIVY